MKFLIVLLLILSVHRIYGQAMADIKDSAGVFKTKEDFLKNQISYSSHYIPMINWIFGIRVELDIYSNFSVYGEIRFEIGDNIWKIFKPGEIFGFWVNGRKYLFIKEDNEYLTVVKEKYIWFYMETGMAPRLSLNPIKKLYYARLLGEEPMRFNKKHILMDFGAENDTTKVLLNILDNLPDNFISGHEDAYKNYVRILNTF